MIDWSEIEVRVEYLLELIRCEHQTCHLHKYYNL